MKKTLLASCCICVVALFSSCYSSTVCVGNMKKTDPAVKVNTVHNSHFLGGLIGGKTVKGKNYVDGAKDYKVKHSLTFTDCLISSITFGIYSPSTTKFYVPIQTVKKGSKKKTRKNADD